MHKDVSKWKVDADVYVPSVVSDQSSVVASAPPDPPSDDGVLKFLKQEVLSLQNGIDTLRHECVTIKELPSLIIPAIEVSLGPALASSVEQAIPTMVNSIIKIVKHDLGSTGGVLDDIRNLGAGIPEPLPNRNIVDADKHTDDAHESLIVEVPQIQEVVKNASVIVPQVRLVPVPLIQTVEKISEAPQIAVPQIQTIEEILTEDSIVGIHSLQNMAALNGTVGIVRGFDDASQRYKIQVEDGTIKKFKRCNLSLEEELEEDYDVCDEDNCDSHFKSFIGSSAAPSRH